LIRDRHLARPASPVGLSQAESRLSRERELL
jgi:hypothetical protein